MPFVIPLRVLTMVIGGILGYSAGFFIELKYKTHGNYRESVETLIQGVKGAVLWEADIESDEQTGLQYCFDCCDSATASCDTEESEGD